MRNEEYDFNKIAEEYAPLISRIAASYAVSYKRYGVEVDDLVQIGLIGLWEAMRYVDPFEPGAFSYIRIVIQRKVRAYVWACATHIPRFTRFKRHEWLNKHNVREEIPISAFTATTDNGDEIQTLDLATEDDCSGVFVEDFINSLNEDEQVVVHHQMRHRRGDRSGRHMAGLSRATYYRRLSDVREKLRAFEQGVNE